MTLLLPLGALALLAFGGSSRRATKRDETDVERIVREGREIVDGSRDAFTQLGPQPGEHQPLTPPAIDEVRPGPSDADMEAAAIRAAVEAADREATSVAPSRPAKAPAKAAPKPTQAPKPAKTAKAAPKPAKAPTTPSTPAATPAGQDQAPARPLAPIPAGYDPAGARRMAPSLARHLKAKGRSNSDRTMVRSFQTKAGIKPDGIYGGGTRGALLYYGAPASDVPAPFFPPLETQPYVAPENT